jgi:predicted  nucleic acid-binding Zn-ribbon protein
MELVSTGKSEKQFRDELEALSKESSLLNEQRIRIQTEIERARTEKATLEASLMTEYGTCDIDALAKILAERENANEMAIAQFRQDIASLREEIENVSSQLAKIK